MSPDPRGVPWGNAAVSSFTLDFQVWAVDYTNIKGIRDPRDKWQEEERQIDTVRLDKEQSTRSITGLDCKRVKIPTYRPQLARLLTSEGFSPNR